MVSEMKIKIKKRAPQEEIGQMACDGKMAMSPVAHTRHKAQGTTVHLQSFVHHGTHAIPFGTLWGLLFKSSVRNIFLLSLALSGPYHYGRPFNNIPGLILWAQYSY